MTGQMESFELESSASASIQYVLLLDDSRRRNFWTLTRVRAIVVTLVGIMIATAVCNIPTRSGSQEELPTKTSVSLDPLSDDENTTTSFLIGDIRSVGTCQSTMPYGDLGFLPFGEEIDRTFCEDHRRASKKYSEVLRCYNVTHRWCFVNELPESFSFDNSLYGERSACIHQFYDHGGILYSPSGQRMPEAFNSKCSDKLEWNLWYTVFPFSGCGKDYRYRFCDKQGNVDWDIVNGVGPFNCREFNAIDLYEQGTFDEFEMMGLCKEQATLCADLLQIACKDGKYNRNHESREVCWKTSYLVEYDLPWGHVNEKGEDLICVPYVSRV